MSYRLLVKPQYREMLAKHLIQAQSEGPEVLLDAVLLLMSEAARSGSWEYGDELDAEATAAAVGDAIIAYDEV